MKLLFTLIALACLRAAVNGKIINCYYGTWAAYRPGDGAFEPSFIDPFLCTHISYTFFGIGDDGAFKSLDTWLDMDDGRAFIRKTIALKQQNPNLKVIAVVGGWNEGSQKYSAMAADAEKRARFISTSVQFVLDHGFDGFDLDWEYPAQRGGSSDDKRNFVNLLAELKAALAPHGKTLGIAVAATEASASQSYDVPAVAANVDFINVMTYDFSGAWDPVTGFNAPLHGNGVNNVETSIRWWLSAGAPASKLLLGMGFYGRTFTLANSAQHGVGAPITGGGTPGPYTRESGYLGYNEICADKSWNVVWDEEAEDPYGWKSNQWVGYDNTESIAKKVELLNSLNLAGAMLWSIETDDFRGTCGPRYPLLTALNKGFGNNIENHPTPPVPTQGPSTPAPPTAAPPSPESCNGADGYYPTGNDCRHYYQCVGGIRYNFECGAGLCWDTSILGCNWPMTVEIAVDVLVG